MTKREYIEKAYKMVSDEINKNVENETFEGYMNRTRNFYFKTMYDYIDIATSLSLILKLYDGKNKETINRLNEYLNEEMK